MWNTHLFIKIKRNHKEKKAPIPQYIKYPGILYSIFSGQLGDNCFETIDCGSNPGKSRVRHPQL